MSREPIVRPPRTLNMSPNPRGKQRKVHHVVDAVHFEGYGRQAGKPGLDAPMDCECGWGGMVRDFPQHRRDVGAYDHGTNRERVPFVIRTREAQAADEDEEEVA